MKILVICNNVERDSWGSEELTRYGHQAAPGSTIYVRRAPHDDLPKSVRGWDRIILSGSLTSAMDEDPWIDRLENFLKNTLNERIPVLGVCYGHQMLGRTMGGKQAVRKAARPEFGWTRIDVLESSPIMEGLPKSFHSFSSHHDEVHQLHPELKLVAKSDICSVQAFEWKNGPAFGVQFHPERNLQEGDETFQEQKKKGHEKHFINPGAGESLYDPKVAEVIFGNFLKGEYLKTK